MASSTQGFERMLQLHPPSWRSDVEDFLSGAAVGFFDLNPSIFADFLTMARTRTQQRVVTVISFQLGFTF